jgi:tRNA-splicing ligase RtcB (3'-phosphate/5'-hydroxy nucleic acid ligase)
MDLKLLTRRSEYEWEIQPHGDMRVPAVIFANEALVRDMDEKVYQQAVNVATLPGIVKASYAMPDAHWGYGFPIGGVAAFDPDQGGVVSAGGVGFDISCGVRCLRTGLEAQDVRAVQRQLAEALYYRIPAGLGSTGAIHLELGAAEMDAMLSGGARWAVEHGWGLAADLERIEECGQMQGAEPDKVSQHAKQRQRDEMGTLGSGNHYLEVQEVTAVFDASIAQVFGLHVGDVVVMIHCGSRGSASDRHRFLEADLFREVARPPPLCRAERRDPLRKRSVTDEQARKATCSRRGTAAASDRAAYSLVYVLAPMDLLAAEPDIGGRYRMPEQLRTAELGTGA